MHDGVRYGHSSWKEWHKEGHGSQRISGKTNTLLHPKSVKGSGGSVHITLNVLPKETGVEQFSYFL